jgi:quercetin dioxygenase-like cupin family protein
MQNARCVKIVQRRPIEFVNRRMLQQHLENGAACLLEGVDILEPQISQLAASLDRAHSCTFSNAVVFFSQRGNEAYRGHLDTDDVLAIHLGGAKKWRIHKRQAPRRANLVELGEAEMGPIETEIVMRPGDVLFLRSGTPHRAETIDDYSLHISFDLCDRAAGIEAVFDLLLKQYDRDALRPYGTVQEVLDKVATLGKTENFRREVDVLQQQRKSGYEEFRSVATSRVTFFDRLIARDSGESRPRGVAAEN